MGVGFRGLFQTFLFLMGFIAGVAGASENEDAHAFLPAGRQTSSTAGLVREAYIAPQGSYLVILEAALPGARPLVYWGSDEVMYQMEVGTSEEGERFFDRRAANSWGYLLPSENRMLVYDGIGLNERLTRLSESQRQRLESKIWDRRIQLVSLPPYLRSESLFGYANTDRMFYVQAYRVGEKDYARVYTGHILNEQIRWQLIQVLRVYPNGQAVVLADDTEGALGTAARQLVDVDARSLEAGRPITLAEGHHLVAFDYVDLMKLVMSESLPKPRVNGKRVVRDLPTPLDLVYNRRKNCELILGAKVAEFMSKRSN